MTGAPTLNLPITEKFAALHVKIFGVTGTVLRWFEFSVSTGGLAATGAYVGRRKAPPYLLVDRDRGLGRHARAFQIKL